MQEGQKRGRPATRSVDENKARLEAMVKALVTNPNIYPNTTAHGLIGTAKNILKEIDDAEPV